MFEKKVLFYENLYIGATVKEPKKMIQKISLRKKLLHTYAIIEANGSDLFEIIHCMYLTQPYYRKHPPYVIGIANGYEEALGLISIIMEDLIKKNDSLEFKTFFHETKE